MSLASRKLIQATAGAAGAVDTGDDDFANVVLLLDGDGTSGDDNNTFTDSSTNGYTVTESGSVVQGSFSPYGDNWSNYFDGSSSLSVTNLTAPGTTFTVEFWVYFNDPNDDGLFQFTDTLGATSTTDRPGLFVDSAGQLKAYANGGNRGTGTTLVAGQWYHIAMVRASSTVNVYVDGTSVWNASETEDFSAHNDLNIGKLYSTGYVLNGYLSNFRYVSGTAVYTASFTPPTAPLTAITNTELLTCQSNRFIDNSSNSYTVAVQAGTPKVTPFSPFKDDDARDITTDGGSAYWNGASYLNTASGATALGTGNLTVEFWINTTDTSFNIMNPDSSTGNGFWGLMVQSGDLRWNNQYNLTNLWVVDGAPILDGAWHHVAIIKNSNVFKVFYDGVSQSIQSGSFTDSYNYPYSDGLRIGSGNLATFTGYLSDIRLLAGTALYSSDFTPPTAPLTAVTNTKLLLNFQDAGIYDRSGINNIDTVGTAQIDTAVVKYGTGSLEINETGNYLKIPSGSLGQALKGDAWQNKWTVECWVRSNSWTTYEGIWMIYQDQNNWIRLFKDTGDTFQVRGYTGGSQQFSVFGGTATDSTFQHLAAVRDGSTIKLYVDGTSVGTPDTIHTLPTFSDSTEMYIGRENFSTNHYLQGFVDDFRITLGVARYTSNFTPPTKALPKF